ncbi:NAD(P)-dependent oxidoreductase [Paraburkholderia terrae]|uniref:NAD(P)-dependent oxidoreductase n=1 Tax=Paraburkholderia terrae TaxID=311230 RepID=UPI0033657CF4
MREVNEQRVGLCGLGKMGFPITRRLINAGRRMAIWNRSIEKAQALELDFAERCFACRTPAELAERVDIVLLCLADGPAVEDVVFGSSGLAEGTGVKSLTVVDHSTISPAQARSLSIRWRETTGGAWIDAPVSGGATGAAAGSLAIFTGGDESTFSEISPVLAAYAANATLLGESGAGQAAKLVNQTIVMTSVAAIAEATLLARHAGVDATRMPAALAGGWADSVLLQTLQPRMVVAPGQPTGSIRMMLKDLDAVEQLARESGVRLPIAGRVRDWLRRAVEEGLGDNDISQVIRVSLT